MIAPKRKSAAERKSTTKPWTGEPATPVRSRPPSTGASALARPKTSWKRPYRPGPPDVSRSASAGRARSNHKGIRMFQPVMLSPYSTCAATSTTGCQVSAATYRSGTTATPTSARLSISRSPQRSAIRLHQVAPPAPAAVMTALSTTRPPNV